MGSSLTRTRLVGLGAAAALAVACGAGALAVTWPPAPSRPGASPTAASPMTTPTPWVPGVLRSSPGSFTLAAEARLLDAGNGWVVSGRLMITSDGARTWRQATPGPATEYWSVGTAEFVDADHGWCLAGRPSDPDEPNSRIFRTADGGRTWLGAPLPAGRSTAHATLSAVSTSTVFALLRSGSQDKGPEWQIYVSRDGGATWDPMAGPAGLSSLNGLAGMAFASELVGIVWANGRVHRTDDGGLHWTPILSTSPDDRPWVESMRAFASTYVASGWVDDRHSVHVSTDAGRTWRAAGALPQEGTVVWDAASPTVWHYYHSSTDGDRPSVIYETRDAGLTWTGKPSVLHLRSPSDVSGAIRSMTFSDADNGWAIVWMQVLCHETETPCPSYMPAALLAVTEDGGANWWLME